MKLIFKVVENQILFETDLMKEFYLNFFKKMNNTNKKLSMDLDVYSPYTSSAQQSLFQAIILEAVTQSGHTYNEIEFELIELFAPFNYKKDIIGKVTKVKKTVSEMTNREFQIFIEQCNVHLIELYDIKFNL